MPRLNPVEQSSGNVFADLGVVQPDVALAKAQFARQISKIIQARKLKQVEVGRILGVDQGKVSALVRGQLAGFSTERMFRFLNALDQHIEIVIRKKRTSEDRASVTVACR